jgi:peptidoglycan hydrolase CwlO-like protein
MWDMLFKAALPVLVACGGTVVYDRIQIAKLGVEIRSLQEKVVAVDKKVSGLPPEWLQREIASIGQQLKAIEGSIKEEHRQIDRRLDVLERRVYADGEG